VIFIVDANKEELAIKEANVLGIPVVAILDSNASPQGIASRSGQRRCEPRRSAFIATRSPMRRLGQSGGAPPRRGIGAMAEPPVEARSPTLIRLLREGERVPDYGLGPRLNEGARKERRTWLKLRPQQ
jgi:hypothetical protein